MRTLCFFLIAACLSNALSADDFNAADFFGRDFYKPGASSFEGRLAVPLNSPEPPAFLDLNNSDAGRAQDRVEFTQTGLVLKPLGEKESCEVELDIGLTSCNATLWVVELDLGASFSFHLRARPGSDTTSEAEYLIQIVRDKTDSVQLRLLTRTRHGFSTTQSVNMPDVSFAKALEFTLSAGASELTATFAGSSAKCAAHLTAGFGLALAASDGRSRVRDLGLDCSLEASWYLDAQTRHEARRALARLNEYSTQGLLAGICQSRLPSHEADLAAYGDREARLRNAAYSTAAFAARFEALESLALALPKLATAQFEAGLSALLAGYPQRSLELFEAATKIKDSSLIRLAAAEASRRLRDFDAAQTNLDLASTGLEERLQPDFELLRGRLLAAKGNIEGAQKVLSAGRARWPKHEQLAAFAESSDELVAPRGLSQLGIAGPLGVTIVSDMNESTLKKLLERLGPFVERIRQWLPGLGRELSGTLAVYNSPTDYLRAALLLAGDSLDNVAGMFLPAGFGGRRSVIACRAFGEAELLKTLVHELWHLAVSSTANAAKMPAWLNEGMAVYLSAGEVGKDKSLTYSQLPSEFVTIRESVKIGLDDVKASELALGAALTAFYVPNSQRMNYAMAWALVWYHAQSGMTEEKLLRSLIAGDSEAHEKLAKSLPELLPRIKKALQERKMP